MFASAITILCDALANIFAHAKKLLENFQEFFVSVVNSNLVRKKQLLFAYSSEPPPKNSVLCQIS